MTTKPPRNGPAEQPMSLRVMRDLYKKHTPFPSSDDVKAIAALCEDPRSLTYIGTSRSRVRSYLQWYLNLGPRQLDDVLLGFFVREHEHEIERLDK